MDEYSDCYVSAETINNFSRPLLGDAIPGEPHAWQSSDTKILPHSSNSLETNEQASQLSKTLHKIVSKDPQLKTLEHHRILFENDTARMHESPFGSCSGDPAHQSTPRLQPTDTARSLLPSEARTDDAPLRQDSAYESIRGTEIEESNVDVEIQARNMRARERVEILRGRVFRTRSLINDRRQELHFLRDRVRNATAKLMQAVNMVMALNTVQDLAPLTSHYEDMSHAQGELGPAEDAYDILENRLNREEAELEQEEQHFYTHNNITLVPLPDSKLDEEISPLVKPYEPEDNKYQDLDLENDLAKQYLSKVSEAEDLKEQLHDLENEQYQITQEIAFRTRHNLPLSEQKSVFVVEFPKEYKGLLEKLDAVEEALYELREQCVSAKLFTDLEYPYEPRDALVDEIYESVSYAMERSPLRSVGSHTETRFPEDTNFKDKREYVNSWLLGWVQDSTVDKMRLKAFIYYQYPKDGKQLEGEEWSDLALEYWDQDEAGKSAKEKPVLRTVVTLLGSTGSPAERLSLDVDLGEDGVGEGIMSNESDAYWWDVQVRTD